jgi:RimJ/RimL family protein N-acetyltransferase
MIQQTETNPRYKFDFAVCLKETGLLIGGCGIRRETELSQVANLGWAINPEFQSKGFATEAARALIEFGKRQLKLSVIYATCDTRNTPSFKLMEKLGMKREGCRPKQLFLNGKFDDLIEYGISDSLS